MRRTGIDLPFSGDWKVPVALLTPVNSLLDKTPDTDHDEALKKAVIALFRQPPLTSYYTEEDIEKITDKSNGWKTGEGSREFNKALIRGLQPTGYADSVLDMIQVASAQGYLNLDLAWREEEQVNFDDLTKDFGRLGGLKPNNMTIVIDGGGRVIDLTGSKGGSLVTVQEGLTLTLRNITFKGLKADDPQDKADNNASIVVVSNGGYFIMEDGVVLRNNAGPDTGGGVYVEGENAPGQTAPGRFTMKGGTITGNSGYLGGGVMINDAGIFTMTGGTISGNSAEYGGGVEVGLNGKYTPQFSKTGGTIAGNSSEAGNAVSLFQGSGRDADAGPDVVMYYNWDGKNDTGFE